MSSNKFVFPSKEVIEESTGWFLLYYRKKGWQDTPYRYNFDMRNFVDSNNNLVPNPDKWAAIPKGHNLLSMITTTNKMAAKHGVF